MFDLSRFSLKDKTAIVTGGGRGIGKEIALGFAKAGAKVVVTSRKIEDLEATVAEIKGFGGEAFAISAHLGKVEEIQKMVEASLQKLGGRIDILVNNAGASPSTANVLDTDERLWDTIMNLNLKGLYFTAQAVARVMKKQASGKIINVSSIDGFKPEHNVSVYSISKAGVRMVTMAFADELAPFNIQVNSLVPGHIETKMMKSRWFHLPPAEAEKRKSDLAKDIPMGRVGSADEVVGAAVFLASDASSYTTGSDVIVDGGILSQGIQVLM